MIKSIDISNSGIEIDGVAMSFTKPIQLATLIGILDVPSHSEEVTDPRGSIWIRTWDEQGIAAWNVPSNRPVSQEIDPDSTIGRLKISLDTIGLWGPWPKRAFGGQVTIDGAIVSRNSFIEDINQLKKGAAFIPSWGPPWHITHHGVWISLGLDDTLGYWVALERLTTIA